MKRQTHEDYIEGRVVKRHPSRVGPPKLNPIHHIFDLSISLNVRLSCTAGYTNASIPQFQADDR
jgi:hypothetical protein